MWQSGTALGRREARRSGGLGRQEVRRGSRGKGRENRRAGWWDSAGHAIGTQVLYVISVSSQPAIAWDLLVVQGPRQDNSTFT